MMLQPLLEPSSELHGKTGTENRNASREKKEKAQEAETARIREQEEQDVLPLPPVGPETRGSYQVPDYDLRNS